MDKIMKQFWEKFWKNFGKKFVKNLEILFENIEQKKLANFFQNIVKCVQMRKKL